MNVSCSAGAESLLLMLMVLLFVVVVVIVVVVVVVSGAFAPTQNKLGTFLSFSASLTLCRNYTQSLHS